MSYKIKGKEYTDQEAYDKFIGDFLQLIEDYRTHEVSDDHQIVQYYGNVLCQTNREPMRDADTIESDLWDEGWTDENLEKLFKDFNEEIMYELNDKSIGGFDVFLYKWTSGHFPLGGNKLSNLSSEEVMIKYFYGWHKTKYGQLILKQNNLFDNFKELVANSYKDEVFRNTIALFLSPGNMVNNWIPNEKRKNIYKKIYQFIEVEKNVITIKYKKVVDTINLIMFINFDDVPEEMCTYDEFVKEIINETNQQAHTSIPDFLRKDEDLIITIN